MNVLHVTIEMERMIPSINDSKQFLSYWAMWESTRYCILSRLRTPFGGPEHVGYCWGGYIYIYIYGSNLCKKRLWQRLSVCYRAWCRWT